jgi:hypothetical protein
MIRDTHFRSQPLLTDLSVSARLALSHLDLTGNFNAQDTEADIARLCERAQPVLARWLPWCVRRAHGLVWRQLPHIAVAAVINWMGLDVQPLFATRKSFKARRRWIGLSLCPAAAEVRDKRGAVAMQFAPLVRACHSR